MKCKTGQLLNPYLCLLFFLDTLIRLNWLRRNLNLKKFFFFFKHLLGCCECCVVAFLRGKIEWIRLVKVLHSLGTRSLFLFFFVHNWLMLNTPFFKSILRTIHQTSRSNCIAVTGSHSSRRLRENPVKEEEACLTYPLLFIITEINCLQRAFHQEPASHW